MVAGLLVGLVAGCAEADIRGTMNKLMIDDL
jgi:hypothetical protein